MSEVGKGTLRNSSSNFAVSASSVTSVWSNGSGFGLTTQIVADPPSGNHMRCCSS